MIIPTEYEFLIPVHELDVSKWTQTKDYSSGPFQLQTTIQLLADVSQANGERTTSVVISLRIPNKMSDCSSYKGFAKVTLHDPNTGELLSEQEEERDFEKNRIVSGSLLVWGRTRTSRAAVEGKS